MKVLIVDDEKHVREGIKLLGAWEQNGITEIYEAGNGEEAIQLIQRLRPEIIFSDMKMPKMDGTQLLEWIKENQPASKTIVVTGYDDYHYMRKAIHFGSSDYLLKPIDPDILNQTLDKVVKEWRKEEDDREKKTTSSLLMNEMKPVYRDRKLTQLMNEDNLKEELYEEFGFSGAQNYLIALVRLNRKAIEAFQGDRDLTYFTILNVINEVLHEEECGIAFRYLAQKGEILIVFWKQFAQIGKRLERIYQAIKKTIGVACHISVGIEVNDRKRLIHSYQHAKQVLLNSNILDDGETKVYKQDVLQTPLIKNLFVYSSEIELAIQTGEIRAFKDLITKIVKDYSEGNYFSWGQLLQLENEYLVISYHWFEKYQIPVKVYNLIEYRVDQFFDDNGTFQLQDYMKRTIREVSIFLKKLKRRSVQRNKNVIYEIEKYLQAHFDREVKLQEISDHFYISREYISRKFKQEFQVNISDYVVKIRMERAKSLLKNSELRIYEIATMVGYQDDKYFRKVFKKVEGVTPNKYRELHFQ
ncbi:response regulator transcription factor [Neobacillus cucumis]|uniref:response regulator transcription factor n=1 Tax=Neobacillus cucumis TaxID=1740721 RepID=UPI0028533DFF|nr:response regulator [Neobacillus cucumis]MDR4945534.1 response regulator [Neobacillus cucumis]